MSLPMQSRAVIDRGTFGASEASWRGVKRISGLMRAGSPSALIAASAAAVVSPSFLFFLASFEAAMVSRAAITKTRELRVEERVAVVATVDCESVRGRLCDERWSKMCSEVRGASAPLGRVSVGVDGVGGGGISAGSWGAVGAVGTGGAGGAGGASVSAACDAVSAVSALLSLSSDDGDDGCVCSSMSSVLSATLSVRGGASESAMVVCRLYTTIHELFGDISGTTVQRLAVGSSTAPIARRNTKKEKVLLVALSDIVRMDN
jgi:hypothetical protein